ncbi:MAG: cohesin domain-containing protein [Patescibacteria group bacterium]
MIKEQLKRHIHISEGPANIFFIVLVALLGIGVLILLYFAYIFTILNIEELGNSFESNTSSKRVVLSLIPEKPFYQENYKIGDTINVVVALDAPLKKVGGVDVFLQYDPSFLELREGNSSGPDSVLRYLNTEFSAFDIFPYFKVDEEMGKIIFSALSRPLREFVGTNGRIATLSFQALEEGETEIKIDFTENSTFDSNVSSLGRDILDGVRNLKLIIK